MYNCKDLLQINDLNELPVPYGVKVPPEMEEKCICNLNPAASTAVEEALTAELPPEGATLVTPCTNDLDAIGAMALLALRGSNNRNLGSVRNQVRTITNFKQSSTFVNGSIVALAAVIGNPQIPLMNKMTIMQKWLPAGDKWPSESILEQGGRTLTTV